MAETRSLIGRGWGLPRSQAKTLTNTQTMTESPRLEELRRRVQADPASIAFAALAEELRRAGRFREAVDTSRAGLRHHPTYVSARVTLGRSLVELQQAEQAERELAFVLRSAPDNLAARRALGELCWQQLRFADALGHFKAAQLLAPRDPELPGVIASLERELEAERMAAVAAAPAPAASASEAASAEKRATFVEALTPDVAETGGGLSAAMRAAPAASVQAGDGAHPAAGHRAATARGRAPAPAALVALERFYRAIVRARSTRQRAETPPPTHATGA